MKNSLVTLRLFQSTHKDISDHFTSFTTQLSDEFVLTGSVGGLISMESEYGMQVFL